MSASIRRRFGRRQSVDSGSEISPPQPQEWSASVDRRRKDSMLSSPLQVLPLTMDALAYRSWEHRIAVVMARYQQKDKDLDLWQVFDEAFATLESLCVGEEAQDSLHAFRSNFISDVPLQENLTPTRSIPQASTSSTNIGESITTLPEFKESSTRLGELDLDFKFPSSTATKPLPSQSSSSNMGKLIDITNRANKSQQRGSTSLIKPKPKMIISTPKDRGYDRDPLPPGFVYPLDAMVLGTPPTPSFMTPTSASRSHSGTPDQDRPSSSRKWVVSAARRVGFSRMPETAKSMRSIPSKGKRDLGGMDQAPTKTRSPEIPSKAPPSIVDKPSSAEKPLPSPPVVQILETSPGHSRTLLDAADKPLRRTPPGCSEVDEEWPVLFPQKGPSSSTTLTPLAKDALVGGSSENTGVAGSIASQVNNGNAMTAPNYETKDASFDIARKPVSNDANIRIQKENAETVCAQSGSGDFPSTLGKNHAESLIEAPTSIELAESTKIGVGVDDMSPSAAAVEKFSSLPRPIRISSLRTRIFDDNGQATGSADTDASHLNVRKPKEIKSPQITLAKGGPTTLRSSSLCLSSQTPSKPRKTFKSRPSPPHRNTSTPPAKFITGSGRLETVSGSNSRASQSGGSKIPILRSRPSLSSVCGSSDIEETSSSPATEFFNIKKAAKNKDRHQSSIPIPRHFNRRKGDGNDSEAEILTDTKLKTGNFKVYEDEHDADVDTDVQYVLGEKRNGTCIGSEQNSHPKQEERAVNSSGKTSPVISKYKVKRLSTLNPEHGPVLRISHSADDLILGTDTTKPSVKKFDDKQDADLHRQVMLNEAKKISESRRSESDSVASMPVLSCSPSIRSMSVRVEDACEEWLDDNSGHNLSCQEDPHFRPPTPFSAMLLSDNSTEVSATEIDTKGGESVSEAEGRSNEIGLHKNTKKQGFHRNNELCKATNTAFEAQKSADEETEIPSSSAEITGIVNEPVAILAHAYGKGLNAGKLKGRQTAPPQQSRAAPSPPAQTSPSSFPPRSSSHAPVPDFTTNGRAKLATPPIAPTDVKNVSIKRSNSNLTSQRLTSRCHSTTQVMDDVEAVLHADIARKELTDNQAQKEKLPNSTQRKDCTSHPRSIASVQEFSQRFHNAHHEESNSKRDSAGQSTVRSQGSASKGTVSKGRLLGIFHKRGSSQSTGNTTPGTSSTAKNISFDENGSPCPTGARQTAARGRSKALYDGTITPAPCPPEPKKDLAAATSLVMRILEDARRTPNGPRKDGLLQLGKLMVGVVTEAREAEKAVTEAQLAAQKAELCFFQTASSVQSMVDMLSNYEGKALWLNPNNKAKQ